MKMRKGVRHFQDGGANTYSAWAPGQGPAPGGYVPPPNSGPTFPTGNGGSFSVNQGVTRFNPPPGQPGMTPQQQMGASQATPEQMAQAQQLLQGGYAGLGSSPGANMQARQAQSAAGGAPGSMPPIGGPGGAGPGGGGMQMSPQQQAALQAFAQQRMGGPGMGQMGPMQQQANPMAQQLAARGAMPTPSPGAGPTSTLGAAAPGGQMPPGMGGMWGGPQGMPQRPGMQGGMPPGGPGGPPQGAGAMMRPMPQGVGAMQAAGLPPQGAAPGGGSMFGAAPGAMQQNPQMTPYMAQQAATAMFAKGGSVSTFDSTKAAPGNLATSPGKGKMAKGGIAKEKKAERKSESKKAPGTPVYDQPAAGDPGWPPGPSFGGGSGAPPAMAKGGKFKKGGECVVDEDKDKMAKGGRFAKGGDCDKMAAGGAAKQRRGFPDTIKPPGKKGFAKGGGVRGMGAAQRGTGFSGIY